MDWLRAIVYGFISGLTGFLPVSSAAHGEIILKIMGAEANRTLLALLTQAGMLAAVLVCCRQQFHMLRKSGKRPPRRRNAEEKRGVLTMRLFRTALFPLIICFLFVKKTAFFNGKLNFIALFLLINGIILFIPDHLPSANRDARSASRFHGLILGLGAGSSIFPGLSSMGAVSSFGSILGMSRQFTLNFAFLLAVPVLILGMIGNLILLIAGGMGAVSVLILLRCLIAAAMAFAGGWCGISLMRFLSVSTGYSWFSYYCWGAALFSFILFMTI